MSDDLSFEEGDTLRDTGTGDTFEVMAIPEDGPIVFDGEYDHWPGEVAGYIEDGLWEVQPDD